MVVTHYQNPILRGMYPDPSIVRVNETYYMVNSTFEYYPGIALSKSTDLLNWTKLPGIARTSRQADLQHAKSNEGIFAVCIRYHDGHFYVITTNFAEFKNIIIRGTLSPNGENIIWDDARVVVDIFGIDPDLYFENGRTYLQFTGYIDDKGTKAIQQVEINLETGDILKGPTVLTLGTGGRDVEGPHIIKKDGYYYLLMAEGGTGVGHMITLFRGTDIWGPYEEAAPHNPIFTNRDRAEEPLQNIGHADFFQDTLGNWWMTCLGTRPATVGFTHFTNIGRETLLYPVDWSSDWPIINQGIPAQVVDLKDFPNHAKTLKSPQQLLPFEDTFDQATLNPEWVSLRSDLGNRLKLEQGKLSLMGSPLQLDSLSTPSFLALRQTEHNEIFSVTLDNENSSVNKGRLGLAVIINSDHFASLTLQKAPDGGYQIMKHIHVLDLTIEEVIGQCQNLPLYLTVSHTTTHKIFQAHCDNGSTIGFKTYAMHFSNEAIGALNTGNFFGLYALEDAVMTIISASRKPLIT